MYTCTLCHEQKPDVATVDGFPAKYALCDNCCEGLFITLAERVARINAELETWND